MFLEQESAMNSLLCSTKKWDDSDEERLNNLKTCDIEMKGTALGRYEEAQRKSLKEAVPKMSADEIADFMIELDDGA